MQTHYLCTCAQIYTYKCTYTYLVSYQFFCKDFFFTGIFFLIENFICVWIIFQSFPFLSFLIIVLHFSPSIDICVAQIFWDVEPSIRAWLTYSGLHFQRKLTFPFSTGKNANSLLTRNGPYCLTFLEHSFGWFCLYYFKFSYKKIYTNQQMSL